MAGRIWVPMAKKSRSRTTPTNVPKVSVAPASPDGPNRKVRKEEARKQREALVDIGLGNDLSIDDRRCLDDRRQGGSEQLRVFGELERCG